ncbi:MAG: siderophore ABC transporter substrate-binding protein [Beutenbergiaceae bacterium]
MAQSRPLAAASLTLVAALALVGCSTSAASPEDGETSAEAGQESPSAAPSSIEVEDNNGTQTVQLPPSSVVALDNRTFQTLSDWGIELSAAAVSLMPDTIAYTQDESLTDIGNHREPNLEAIVAAQPDLIINGQRFTQFQEDITSLVPQATVLVLDPREGEPFDAELIRQSTTLGEIFGKQAEAAELVQEFEDAIGRVQAAYDPAQTVMAVNVSGGEIGYLAPTVGRTLGPVFDFANLTAALEIDDASDDHQGDDISVEAIADANPDWILVMDRDAAVSADDPAYQPAADIIENSEALAGVNAVQGQQIVYMPADTYTNEGIQTYTEFLNDFADALEAAN